MKKNEIFKKVSLLISLIALLSIIISCNIDSLTYNVTYNANGATSGTVPSQQLKTYNQTLILQSNSGNLDKIGYSFVGWNTEADGSGTSYKEGAEYKTDEILTLYAEWTPITYTITYDKNGATGGNPPDVQIKEFGTDIKLLPNSGNLVKTGLAFAGWNTSSDGTGTQYKAGDSYPGNGDITLYASWITEKVLKSAAVKNLGFTDGKFNWGSETYTTIGANAFYENSNLKSIEIPDTITKIETQAFYKCENLTSIVIPNSVTDIGNYVFSKCKALTSVELPNSILKISENLFAKCINLQNFIISQNITTIEDEAFLGCTNLTKITIPKNVVKIGKNVFGVCENLQSLEVDMNNPNFTSENNIIYNKDKTMILLASKASGAFVIPSTVTSFADSAFSSSTITSITIPNGISKINDGLFNGCSSLSEIKFPNGVKEIGFFTFYGCDALITIKLPDDLETICESAFSTCSNLTTVDLPKSLKTISSFAFEYCTNLKTINYGGTKDEWGKVIKKSTWNKGSTNLKNIQCTDGIIIL